jgi:hypothetical protein
VSSHVSSRAASRVTLTASVAGGPVRISPIALAGVAMDQA